MARLLTPPDYRATRWKNGGGSTSEIAVSPLGAGLEDFDWRISIAAIERSGAFSTFAGVDRTLVLLEGAALRLRIDGQWLSLSPRDPMLSFAGEQAVQAEVGIGATLDFNVMSRRAGYRHHVERAALSGRRTVACDGVATLLFAAVGADVGCRDGNGAHWTLRCFDSLWLDAGDTVHMDSAGATVLIVDLNEEPA